MGTSQLLQQQPIFKSLQSPILYHYFPAPISYSRALLLQQTILSRRLEARRQLQLTLDPPATSSVIESLTRTASTDILLLLEHKPVYTAGRRMAESDDAIKEGERLVRETGAEWSFSKRGGEITFHGIGQMVGYCSMDLALAKLTTRQYVETLELYLSNLVKSFSVPVLTPSPHTGVFTTPFTKIGSIGIHLQHRLTLHGFCLNITSDPLPYFDQVVACGLTDVSATSIEKELGKRIEVTDVVERSALAFGQEFGREIRRMDEKGDQDREWADLIRKGMEGTLDEIEIT